MTMHEVLADVGGEIGRHDRQQNDDEERRLTADQRERSCDEEPDEPQRPDAREVDEEPVEPTDAVRDDPVLEVPVETDQAGTSCLARSISCCGSNGFPMNPRAPRSSAWAADCSST